jgi:hypothetical protein
VAESVSRQKTKYMVYMEFSKLGGSGIYHPYSMEGQQKCIPTQLTGLFQKDCSLIILLQFVGVDGIPGLPSWVPDYNDSSTRAPLCIDWSKALNESPAVFPFNDRFLWLDGQIVDMVDTVAEATELLRAPSPDDTIWNPEDKEEAGSLSLVTTIQMVKTFQSWVRLGRASHTYPTGESINNALYKTLCLNGVTIDRKDT